MFSKVTTETLQDWETCLRYGIAKIDPNRIQWLFKLFLDYQENNINTEYFESSEAGAFNQCSFLKLFRILFYYQWKTRELFDQIFLKLKKLNNHPYHMVRKEIAMILVPLLGLDVKYGQVCRDIFPGFPKIKQYLDEVLPILIDGSNSTELTFDIAKQMELITTSDEKNNNILEDEADRKKSKETYHKTLETVALWIREFINRTCIFITFPKEVYKMLPFLCQFVDNEEIYKSCLDTLSFWSISITPYNDISYVLDIIWQIMVTSNSRKAKLNCLNFFQNFLSTNFMVLCFDENLVSQIETQILNFMADPRLQVRQKASKICCGLIHLGFFDQIAVQNKLLKYFHTKISHNLAQKVTQVVQFKRQTSIKFKGQDSILDCVELATYHSGILGLCSIVEAHPYDIPKYLPGLLMELAKHLHDPQPIPKTIKDTFQEFKRTHQDSWQEHKMKFTDDELVVLNDLLISPNYYA